MPINGLKLQKNKWTDIEKNSNHQCFLLKSTTNIIQNEEV